MSQATLKKIINTYGMVLILIILFLLLSVSIEGFFSARTVWSIIEQVSMFGIIAIGVTFAIITTGIDLSSGSVVALTSLSCKRYDIQKMLQTFRDILPLVIYVFM